MACWRSNALALALLLFILKDCLGHDHLVAIATRSTSHSHTIYRRDVNSTDSQDLRPDIKNLQIDSIIKYRYANTVIFTRIANRANVSREIGFKTVLPDSAFISGFAITMNGEVYKAYVKEKEEARRIYQEAVDSGRTAGHVELSARDSNTFTVSVNVEPFGKVAFNLTYEELLTRELGTYKHKISLDPGQIVKNMQVQVVIEESSNITILQVPDLRESNELLAEDTSVNSLATIDRPNGTSAVIRWAPTPEQQREIKRSGVKGLLEVRYDVDRAAHPNQILVNEGYFVHFFAPSNLNPLHKHVVFVLDRSGSMYGRKIEQLKEAMHSILDELRPGDTFSIVLFSDHLLVWQTNGQLVSPNHHGEPISPLVIASVTLDNIRAAKSTVDSTEATGGTHIYDALDTALSVIRLGRSSTNSSLNQQQEREPMIIFLTDGQANGPNSGSETIINHTTTNNINPAAVIYGLAFGDDADLDLLKKLSLKSSGFARKIYEASDASLQLRNFYREVSSPLLSNVSFHYLGEQVNLTTLTKTHFRTHNNGSEIAVAGQLNNMGNITGEVTARSLEGEITLTTLPFLIVEDYYPRPPVIQNASEAGFMERLWAYLTIRQLLDLKDETGDNATIKEEAMELAMRYSFVTPLTSLVVVKPNETNAETDLQAAQSPANQNSPGMQSFPMPAPRRRVSYAMPHLGAGTQSYQFGSAMSSLDINRLSRTSINSNLPNSGRRRYRGRSRDTPDFGFSIPSTARGGAYAGTQSYLGQPRTQSGQTGSQTYMGLQGIHQPQDRLFYEAPMTQSPLVQLPSISGDENQLIIETTSILPVASVGDPQPNPVLPLSDYIWFSPLSNETHISLLINGTMETLQIGYNETNTAFSVCSSALSQQSHCRHLPHCALSTFSQDVNIYLQYFCRINNFIGVCCPDHALPQAATISR